jgi:two-component system sensor histidine kinase YesM
MDDNSTKSYRMILKNTSIRIKTVLLLVLLTFIPISLLGFTAYIVSSQIIIGDVNESTLKAMGKTASDIDTIINNQHVMLDNLSANSEIISLINAGKTDVNEKQVNRLLQQQLANMNVDMSLYALASDGTLFTTTQINRADADAVKTQMAGAVSIQKNPAMEFSVQDAGMLPSFLSRPFPSRTFYSYKNVLQDGEYVGTFVSGASEYRFSRLLDNIKTSEGYVFVLNGSGTVVIHEENNADPGPDLIRAVSGGLLNGKGYDTKKVGGETYIVCYYYIENENWRIVMVTPYSCFYEKLSRVRDIMIAASALAACMLVLLVWLMNRSVINPVLSLSSLMRKVERGDLRVRADIRSNDEIGVLNRGFNRMLDEFERLIDNAVEDERSKKALQFRALQEQIKPHFLYNTMNTIRWIAEIQNAGVVAAAIVALGRLFEYKYSLKNEFDFVKVEEEIRYLKDYIYLQQIRYIDAFSCNFMVEDEAAFCRIIKFILQPFVENAIIHGFKNMKSGGIIDVTACRRKDMLHIRISDNGEGIGEEALERIRRGDGDTGIGIPNVQERLKIHYGGNFFLSIVPRLPCGTVVEMRIPAENETGASEHDQTPGG